jgi:hypothetical protein
MPITLKLVAFGAGLLVVGAIAVFVLMVTGDIGVRRARLLDRLNGPGPDDRAAPARRRTERNPAPDRPEGTPPSDAS